MDRTVYLFIISENKHFCIGHPLVFDIVYSMNIFQKKMVTLIHHASQSNVLKCKVQSAMCFIRYLPHTTDFN